MKLSEIIPSRDGHLYDQTGKKLKEYLHKASGNYVVRLKDDTGKAKLIYVHKLIAEAFVQNPDPINFNTVLHIDGNKLNNVPENLRWISPREKLIEDHESGKYTQHLQKLNEINCRPLEAINVESGDVVNFKSISEASAFIAMERDGLNPINVRLKLTRMLKGTSKVAYGYEWRELK